MAINHVIHCMTVNQYQRETYSRWPSSHNFYTLYHIDPLRVLARYEAQNRPLFYIFVDIFINSRSFKNLDLPSFYKRSIDAKSVLTFEKCPLVTELKLKMSKSHQAPFSISALPLEGAFQM